MYVFAGEAGFQMKLKRVDDCQSWTVSYAFMYHMLYDKILYNQFKQHANVANLKTHIEEALIEAVERRCKCIFPYSHLLNGSFYCQSSSTQATYRNMLIGTNSVNATQIVSFIQNWVSSGASVKMDWYNLEIDRNCPVAIGSLTGEECR